MTKLKQAARQALEYCEDNMVAEAENVLRLALYPAGEALAEPELNLNCKSVQKRLATVWGYVKAEQVEQEPVLCVECGKPTMHIGNKCYACCQKDTKDLEDALKSWDAEPARTKDLTDYEIDCIRFNLESGKTWIDFARAVIAADREKNRCL